MKTIAALLTLTILLVACGGSDKETPGNLSSDDGPPVATAVPTRSAERLSVANWAAQFCGLAQTYEDKLIALGETVTSDPSKLNLQDRVARSRTITEAIVQMMQAFIDGASRLNPPVGAEAYHKAVIKQVSDEKADRESGQIAANKATSVTELEALNAQSNIVSERAKRDVEAAAAKLPPDIVAALKGVQKCGPVT